MRLACDSLLFFFNDTATTEIYTLSLHDALPISIGALLYNLFAKWVGGFEVEVEVEARPVTIVAPYPIVPPAIPRDRKSTRLNSSHGYISYAVFCLKKKKYISRSISTMHDLIRVN